MSARLLEGRPVSENLRKELASRAAAVEEERGSSPHLAILAVGGDVSSQVYLRNKLTACRAVGVETTVEALPEHIAEAELFRIIQRLGADPALDGILLELPLPGHLDARRLTDAVAPDKDVEGVTTLNMGKFYSQNSYAALKDSDVLLPCTANSAIQLLLSTGVELRGKNAVVLGRSNIVGKPVAHLLACLDATVTLCHSRTVDIASHVKRAEILVSAIGQPAFVKGDWIKPGAVVIDAGFSKRGTTVCGDVDFAAASERASIITPVPGGVGPLTVTSLLYNAVVSAERRIKRQLRP